VSVCPLWALTFESLNLETSFLVCWHIFRISRPSLGHQITVKVAVPTMGYMSVTHGFSHLLENPGISLIYFSKISRTWKVLENVIGRGKSFLIKVSIISY